MRQRSIRVFIVFILIPFCQLVAQSRMPAEVASLHPAQGLTWQRVRPAQTADGALEGPVLYQLLLNAGGTPGTVPMFDTNPRHLTNSPITVSGGNIVIGGNNGLIINGGNGLVTFNSGQVFPGTTGVNSVTAGDSFIAIGGTPLNPTVGLNTANTDQRYLQLSGGVMTGNITFANGQTFPQVTLAGEVTGPASANVVSNAVSTNTANAIVRRDGSGDFSADTINLGGILALPNTASASVGVLTLGGKPFLHNFGTNSTFVGASAGNMGLTGMDNTAVGNLALSSVTTGSENSAFGSGALAANKVGNYNSSFGTFALSHVTGDGNSAFGDGALSLTTTGVYNSVFGFSALPNDPTGSANTVVGAFALVGPTDRAMSGSGNVAIGRGALGQLPIGDFNTAIGYDAGSSLDIGFPTPESNNIFISNTGVSGDSGMIRIGTNGTQTATFIAGINGVTIASGTEVFINSSGQMGTVTSSRRFK